MTFDFISSTGAPGERGFAAVSLGLALSVVAACAGEEGKPTPDAGSVEEVPDAGEPARTLLTLNDVSVLFPLPADDDSTAHLRPTDAGARGELLPKAVFDTIPTFPVVPFDGLVFARMRVLALRFDGCGGPRGACVPQIRLVMQPIATNGVARDSALHLFYVLSGEQMAEVVAELRRLRTLAPEVTEGPLDVHPALVAQGVDGAYGTALRALVLRYAGAENLERVTFFLRAPPTNEVWFFGGLERKDDTYTAMNIVGVGRGNQRVIRTKVENGWDYDLTPLDKEPEDVHHLLTSAAAEAAGDANRRETMAAFLRLENPAIHLVDELSCAGCHIAPFITAETTRRYALAPSEFPEDAYHSNHDLTQRGQAATTPSSLRAFGWFKDLPMISQRAINESAAVVDHLEATWPE